MDTWRILNWLNLVCCDEFAVDVNYRRRCCSRLRQIWRLTLRDDPEPDRTLSYRLGLQGMAGTRLRLFWNDLGTIQDCNQSVNVARDCTWRYFQCKRGGKHENLDILTSKKQSGQKLNSWGRWSYALILARSNGDGIAGTSLASVFVDLEAIWTQCRIAAS